MRRQTTREKRKYEDDWDIDDDDIEGFRQWDLQEKLNSNKYNANFIKRFENAECFDFRYFQKNGFNVPLYFRNKSGLGIKVPENTFTVDDVKKCVGTRRLVDVMDVRTQKALTMNMNDWCKYYNKPEKERLLNVISLEFSHTKLDSIVCAPTVVKQLDWVERVWPQYLRNMQKATNNDLAEMKYPKVRKYCLMSVKGCFTDFHIDFGGSSVWYHILRGEKVFWVVPPTENNLYIYEKWSVSGKQGETFFPDLVGAAEVIHLVPGTTFFIPPGWIHGVYTPEDALVFGGNYMHTFGGRIQLKVWDIEEVTHVKQKYRYPFFQELHWYVLAKYVNAVMNKNFLIDIQKEKKEALDVNIKGSSSAEIKLETVKKEENEVKQGENVVNKEEVKVKQEIPDIDRKPPEPFPPRIGEKMVTDLQRAMKARKELQHRTESLGDQTDRNWIHLSKFEVENLQCVISWLRKLPEERLCVPDDIIEHEKLLRCAQLMINLHKHDDFYGKAITGESVLMRERPKKCPKEVAEKPKPIVRNVPRSGVPLRRRVRCLRCEPCRRDNCRVCIFCRDMAKYGGPGILRKPCMKKACISLQLPNNVVCDICYQMTRCSERQRESDNYDPMFDLFECGICWTIVHPRCLYKRNLEKGIDVNRAQGIPREDLPNYWECPTCVLAGMEGKSKPRLPKALSVMKTFETSSVEGTSQGHRQQLPMESMRGDAYDRMMSIGAHSSVGRPRKPKTSEDTTGIECYQPSEPSTSSGSTSTAPEVATRPMTSYTCSPSKRPLSLSTNPMDDYIDHEEVVRDSVSVSQENTDSTTDDCPSLPTTPKVFIVPLEGSCDRFEDRFVLRTSSRGDIQRPRRFIEEG